MNKWFLVFLEDELVWKFQAKSEQVAENKFFTTFSATMEHDPGKWANNKTIRLMSEKEYAELSAEQ